MSGVTERIKVLYIAGSSRSGSTLLARMLNELDGFSYVGEVHHIWDRGLRQNWPCGCGVPIRDCEFWRAVVEETFADGLDLGPDEVLGLASGLHRFRHLPLMAWPALRPPAFDAAVRKYAEVLLPLYRAIHRRAARDVIVDSSKAPYYALLLGAIPQIDLHVVHLVRDSRAVAYSWCRQNSDPDLQQRQPRMAQVSPFHASLIWNYESYFFGLVRRRSAHFSTLLYDDLVIDPKSTLENIAAQADVRGPDLSFVSDKSVSLDLSHSVSANPNRFVQGPVAIKGDDEWENDMPRSHKVLVTALTWPYLKLYGILG